MSCPCVKEECKEEWTLFQKPDIASDDDDEDGLHHCEVGDCHNIYWGFKDGTLCEECGTRACQKCHSQTGYHDQCDNLWHCASCAVNLKLTSPCPCTRPECIKEWKEYENDKELSHCQTEGCHDIYWSFKNGGWCANNECGVNACEGCMTHGYHDEKRDDWYCEKCKPNVKSIIKRRKHETNRAQIKYMLEQLQSTKKRKVDEEDNKVTSKKAKTESNVK
jgi:hypothetical protein